MLRVLHVISSLEARHGGPTTELVGLATALSDIGVTMQAISTSSEESSADAARKLRSAGVDVALLPPVVAPLMWSPKIAPMLRRMIADSDVVHVKGVWEEIQHRACVIARDNNVPYVISPSGMLSEWSLAQSPWRKRIYMAIRLKGHLRHAALLHYSTEMERDSVQHLKLNTPGVVEPIGVNFAEFESLPPRGSFREKHPQLLGKKVIVFLGRVHPGKGLEQLIPAMQSMPSDVWLLVIGPDSRGHLTEVQARARALGVSDRILFTGALSGKEKVSALRDGDVFALPSEHENFGIAVVEAMAAGLPVVISDQVGVAEMLKASDVVSIVPLSVPSLAAVLQSWLDSSRPREQIAEAAITFARTRFDWREIAMRWRDHYTALCGKRP